MIVIGSDHAGYDLKAEIIAHLTAQGIELLDAGCNGESCDYPEIAVRVTEHIKNGECDKGILVCGTGIGMSMAANKVDGIRAALCSDCFSAKYTRLHNDANVLCMGARTTGPGLAAEITDIFLNTEFEGGRHQRRIDMFTEIEKNKE